MKTISETILEYAHSVPEGRVLSPKEFLHMGNRTAVDQALSRLSREGHLIRVDRGAYVAPVRRGGGSRPPSAKKVIESLAALSGELIAPDGASSAMVFGLAKQGWAAPCYVTTGRSRILTLGEVEVVLRHSPAWMLVLANEPAGAAVRVMAWLGPEDTSKALPKIRRSLSSSEWMSLVACRASLPSWMARAVGESDLQEIPGRQLRRLVAADATAEALAQASNQPMSTA
ncbi:DUF6088 family protein [Delftia lacustris]|uniref:DUF6088 family protein n=1 Tax=Delftia lacustris TaxID=558537 RepID=UPI0028634D88|nr:DUF6088 family protein [Delftia lacustris]MDR6728462.1 hypothetical protein [Delftia lacustris]